ncbi:MAG: adenosylmethionine--8-amino-7-oxononanoate transaminase [Gemmataceae bacterium]|nr:adenosylmethionine--8-amino-7-oxononanoate transaminase [Gemmataceae bacterium]
MKQPLDLLEHWDREHCWHPFTPMAEYGLQRPTLITRAEGFFLFDQDGNKYLDAFSSLWCNVHGHQVAEIDEAIRQQLKEVAHTTFLGLSHPTAIQLARKLVELAPAGLTRVFFSDDGATAVEVAIKMAFQYLAQRPDPKPEKTLFLSLTGAYHGDTLGDVSLGDMGKFHALFKPLLFPTLKAPAPYCYRCPLGLRRESCAIDCAATIEKMVEENASRLAAVVIEPLVQGAAGMITAPAGFLKRLRDITQKHDVLLIADEVATGFGRTGTLFACEQEGVVPDFLCLAKGITGGYLPLAATLTRESIFQAFHNTPGGPDRTFQHGHTYTANPLGAAAAMASINLLTQPGGTLSQVMEKGERLQKQLDRLQEFPQVGEVRRRGLMAGIEIVKNRATKDPWPEEYRAGNRVCQLARKKGVMIRPLGDVVVVMPPLAISGELVDLLGEVLYNSFMEFALVAGREVLAT